MDLPQLSLSSQNQLRPAGGDWRIIPTKETGVKYNCTLIRIITLALCTLDSLSSVVMVGAGERSTDGGIGVCVWDVG